MSTDTGITHANTVPMPETGAAPEGTGTWKFKNPINMFVQYHTKKRLEHERLMVLREELMMEDLERYLMELEDKRSWICFQLSDLNYQRMVRKETLARLVRKQTAIAQAEEEEYQKEDGLSFFQGNIENYKRWQNSPAKHWDFAGHKGAVTACRLSKDLKFMLSCSEDRTVKIWSMETGECIRTLLGHKKIVNDVDFHQSFQMYRKPPCIVSCSGDATLKLWNSSDTKAVLTISGHLQAVYKCSFAPDGTSFISCSEDRTIRTWSFPEGFNLFVYRGHRSPVTTVRYSLSGR
jgi:WD40 repeat protein